MSLKEKLNNDIKSAMKSKDTNRLGILRVVVGELDRSGKDPSDVHVLKEIRKMHTNATMQNNLVEANILESYLPKMYSEDQLRSLLSNIIFVHNFTSMKDMGAIMGIIAKHPDKLLIDNRLVSTLVKEYLS